MVGTVLIVDDNPGFRRCARTLLEAEGLHVVAETGSGEEAFAAVAEHRPDLVLLDVRLPGIDGFEVARRLADRPDAPEVVLTSSHAGEDFPTLIAGSGARGYVAKDELSGASLRALLR